MQRKILWICTILRKISWNKLVISNSQKKKKKNTNRSLDIQIGLLLKDSSSRPQQVVEHSWLKGNMSSTKNC